MKKNIMKLIGTICFIAFVALTTPFRVFAQNGGNETVSAEDAAKAFLRSDQVEMWRGNFRFERVTTNSSVEVYGDFDLASDQSGLTITRLSINGTNIPLTEPLLGLPANTVGVARNYSVNLVGLDQGGYAVIYGNFYADVLLPGAPIDVLLQPAYVRSVINRPLPPGLSGQNAQVKMVDGEGYGFWDSQAGLFLVFVNPFHLPTRYEIVDGSTGRVIAVGDFPRQEKPSAPTESPMNLAYEGGVQAVPWGSHNWASFGNQTFSTNVWVERGGQMVPARVYMAYLDGLAFQVEAYGLANGSSIELRDASEKFGDAVVIASAVVDDTQKYPVLIAPPGTRAVIVTIVGKSRTPYYGFSVNFYRGPFINPPSPVGGGKGLM